jgi:hypothetical protein
MEEKRGGSNAKNNFDISRRSMNERTRAERKQCDQGPMLCFFAKKSAKNWRFWLKTKLNSEKIDHNIGFWEKRQCFRRKLQKIVIITSTHEIFLKNDQNVPKITKYWTLPI